MINCSKAFKLQVNKFDVLITIKKEFQTDWSGFYVSFYSNRLSTYFLLN